MFKRCMALFLALILAFGLVACGDKEDKTPTEPDVEQTQPVETPTESDKTEDETKPNEGEDVPDNTTPSEPEDTKPTEPEETQPVEETILNWTTDFIETPLLPALRVTSQSVVPGVHVKISTTPFNFNIEEMLKKFNNVDFLKQNYAELTQCVYEKYDNEYYTNGGYAFSYAGNDEIISDRKGDASANYYQYSDLKIGASRNTAEYSNYYSLYVDMKNLPKDVATQDGVKTVADIIFGEWSYYLMTAEDMDDRDLDGNKLSKGQMEESVTASDGTVYSFTRKITQNDDKTVNIYLKVGVYNNPHRDTKVTTFGKNIQPIYIRFSKKLGDILPKSFGQTEITQYRTFGDAYFNAQSKDTPYSTTELTRCETYTYTSSGGKKFYSFDADFEGVREGGEKSKFSIAYSFADGSQMLQDVKFTISGTTHTFDNKVDITDRSKAGKMIMDDIKKSLSLVLTEADLSSLVFDESQANSKAPYEKTYNVSAKILHQTVTAKVTVKMGSVGDVAEGALNTGSYTIKISW